MNDLAVAVWPDIRPATTVLVPVGSTEQHGPHLPLDTDVVIAQAVALAVAERLAPADVLVAPAITYGSSGEHQEFPGTSSIGTEVLALVLIELVRSMSTWAGQVVFVNAHGGNIRALRDAVATLRVEGHDVDWVACATENVDLHAGRTETSLMLHIRPDSVRMDRVEAGNTSSLEELLPEMVRAGVRAVSANGVLGDPRGATATEGKLILEDLVNAVARSIVPRTARQAAGSVV